MSKKIGKMINKTYIISCLIVVCGFLSKDILTAVYCGVFGMVYYAVIAWEEPQLKVEKKARDIL